MTYDKDNVFAQILRGEIPNKTVFENEHALAFHDIHPQAPVHVLVIPKSAYATMAEFIAQGTQEEHAAFISAIGEVVQITGLARGGFRTISNNGPDGIQEVPHFHMHVLGGRPMGRMLSPSRD
ncbi:MAG: histidine triad nucleotide-binding protein [Rhodospirillaceae bacterium]|nr:histidine triad nucleotide-binding protein [Rhodospirillaceae bacterium]